MPHRMSIFQRQQVLSSRLPTNTTIIFILPVARQSPHPHLLFNFLPFLSAANSNSGLASTSIPVFRDFVNPYHHSYIPYFTTFSHSAFLPIFLCLNIAHCLILASQMALLEGPQHTVPVFKSYRDSLF